MKKRDEDIILPPGDLSSDGDKSREIREAMEERLERITEEFEEGFKLIQKYPKSVSFFGSARSSSDNPYYKLAQETAKRVAEMGYAVITGGGLGIMEGANKGAHEAGGHSVGLNIELPSEQSLNKFTTKNHEFHYFFSRKMMLSFAAEAYVFFPGGYGTLDEFFEIATLIQTDRIPPVPMICVGSEYWNLIDELIKEHLGERHKTISPEDASVYKICDDVETIIGIIKEAPIRHIE